LEDEVLGYPESGVKDKSLVVNYNGFALLVFKEMMWMNIYESAPLVARISQG
jgi:hypothetical protein